MLATLFALLKPLSQMACKVTAKVTARLHYWKCRVGNHLKDKLSGKGLSN